MGEVYRARDSRLQRDVAVKVLPRALAEDKDRLKRFEREARAAGQLNHPNIMAVHDIGSTEANGGGLPYIVCELLEGTTLRTKLTAGPIPPRKAIQYATQVARGLAAAHAKGIAHRDLKPENLMILAGDHVKILDFGLAKLLRPDPGATGTDDDSGPIAGTLTMTGEIFGTPSYMSPEQVRDQPSDHRTDIFALGAILYEMLTGRRAFDGPTPADRMTAILTSEPPPLPIEIEDAAPGIGAVIAHAIEKSPGDRFDSASDLAFALSLVTQRSSAPAPATTAKTPSLRRMTFREGTVYNARFSPDGQSIYYSAAWGGAPMELYWGHPGNPEPRTLGYPGSELHAVSSAGEMAISLKRKAIGGFRYTGMLARMPIGGGAPREVLAEVNEADWGPARQLAVVRDVAGMSRIECPIGKVLFQSSGWQSHMRVSPDGTRIAFMDHPWRGNDAGSVVVVDMEGNSRKLSEGWSSTRGLAWSPDGREVWFTAFRTGASRMLYAVTLEGEARPVFQTAGDVNLMDISRQGEVLVIRAGERQRMELVVPGGRGRDLTWLDWSVVRDISMDGRTIIFDETGVGGGEQGSVYMRDADGSPAVRLGEGLSPRLSPDGRWVVAWQSGPSGRGSVILLPTGAGEMRIVPTGTLEPAYVTWFPDGKHLCACAKERGEEELRLYELDVATGAYRAFSENVSGPNEALVSPDGKWAAARDTESIYTLYPLDGSPTKPVPAVVAMERAFGVSADSKAIFAFERGAIPAKMTRIDIATGERMAFGEVSPSAAGVDGISIVRMTQDEKTIVYSYPQGLSELYMIEGLR